MTLLVYKNVWDSVFLLFAIIFTLHCSWYIYYKTEISPTERTKICRGKDQIRDPRNVLYCEVSRGEFLDN